MEKRHNHDTHERRAEQGSAIIYVLVAVALFAALSFAVSNISRQGGSADITDEIGGLAASEIMQSATSYRNAVRNARIEGCSDTDISFANNILSGYTNTNNPPDRCKIFDRASGGVSYMEPLEDWLDRSQTGEDLYGQWYFAQGVCAEDIGSGGSLCNNDSYKDLIAFLPFIDAKICRILNARLGISPDNATAPPVENGDAWRPANTRFTGTYSGGSILLEQDGNMSGCFEGSGANTPPAGTYHFFQVLLSR